MKVAVWRQAVSVGKFLVSDRVRERVSEREES